MKFIVPGLILSLLVILLQDLKFRKIHIALPVLIFILSVLNFNSKPFLESKVYILNAVFFNLIFFVLIGYMILKNKKVENPFLHYFGFGDFLYFLAVTPLFMPQYYILYFILSMLFSIIMQLLLKKYMFKETVPLAGFSALLLAFLVLKDVFFHFNKITLL